VTPLATAIFAAITVAAFVLAVLALFMHPKRRSLWTIVALAGLVSGAIVYIWGIERDETTAPEPAPSTTSPTQPALPLLSPPYPLSDILRPEPERISATIAGTRQASVPSYSLTAKNCATPSLSLSGRLGGDADRVTGSFALDEGTPADIRANVQILVGNENKFDAIIAPTDGQSFDISVAEADSMTIGLSTLGSTTKACTESEYDLLILDAIVQ
jgi:hypothetical protein